MQIRKDRKIVNRKEEKDERAQRDIQNPSWKRVKSTANRDKVEKKIT